MVMNMNGCLIICEYVAHLHMGLPLTFRLYGTGGLDLVEEVTSLLRSCSPRGCRLSHRPAVGRVSGVNSDFWY